MDTLIKYMQEEGGGGDWSVCFSCICLFVLLLSFFSSSWCRGLAAVCDCGTPWTFLLTLFL